MVTATAARRGSSRSPPISTSATSAPATGGRWGIASVHQILTRTTYIGQHRFNTRDHKTRTAKPEAEHAVMDVPPIITEAEFEAVQAALKAHSPHWMPPRAVSGPTLLTGICFCASCGGAMTLRTGKGSAGGMYRYYTCSTKARQGERGCRGLTVPMDKLEPRRRRSPGVAAARSGAFDDDDGSGA
ncbi:MAG: recombinase family protein [Burkholderiaceae bacterium]